MRMDDAPLERTLGCMLGALIGDAVGRKMIDPELEKDAELKLSDEGQRLLFVAEGVMRGASRVARGYQGSVPSSIWYALQRWLATQGEDACIEAQSGLQRQGLFLRKELHSSRNPSPTVLNSLREAAVSHCQSKPNSLLGASGISHAIAIGLTGATLRGEWATQVTSFTHGSIEAQSTAACLAQIVGLASTGTALPVAVNSAIESVEFIPLRIQLSKAMECIETDQEPVFTEPQESVEALCLALYATVKHRGFEKGLGFTLERQRVSTASSMITGGLLGAWLGLAEIPAAIFANLELVEAAEQLAKDYYTVFHGDGNPVLIQETLQKYPPELPEDFVKIAA